ncbi:AAA family ATPase [Arenibaculum pallidiluteum]|uniref:AAA family ATPase n=1 Tax=Arenibaculum pallidiluteum TaxID=2812559 RepID=UPI001A957889|nr:AAA family ATPase [Arenibaculum pallidiluteum]
MTTFRRWFDAGFTDIIPIVPPGAPLSPNTKIRPTDRGKVPGAKGIHGWHSFDWRSHVTVPAHCGRWHAMGASIGLKGDRFPGVDLDITDAGLAEVILKLALDTLGPAPVRTGRAPKQLLPYRLAGDEPVGLMRMWFRALDDRDHLVEIRGAGQQYVIDGIHPATGLPYTWDRRPASPDELTPVTKADLERFLAEAASVLEMLGCERIEREDSTGAERANVDQAQLVGDADAVAEAVEALPNTSDLFPGRTDYLRVGYAIKAALPDQPERARELWVDWAMRWEGNDRFPHGNELEAVEADWERMRPPFGVGAQFLFDHAARHGGFNSAAVDFDPVSEEPRLEDLIGPKPADDQEPRTFAPRPKRLPEGFSPKTLPPRPWVLGHRFMRGVVTGGIGAPGGGKSTMGLLSGLSIVTGRELTGERVHVRGRVWIHNHEDDETEILRRLAGMCLHYGIDFDEIRDGFLFSSGVVQRLRVAVKDGDQVKQTRAVAEIIDTIRAEGIVYMGVDPFVSTHDGVSENSNDEIEKVISAFRHIAQQTGCAIDLVHHSVKNHSGNTEARAGDMNAARGASALIGAIRIAYTLAPMSEKSADEMGLDPARAATLVRLDMAKGNYSGRVFEPRWFEMVSVLIGNDPDGTDDLTSEPDTVGVPVIYDMRSALAAAGEKREETNAQEIYADAIAIAGAFASGRQSIPQGELAASMAGVWNCGKSSAETRIRDAALDADEGKRRLVTIHGRDFHLYRRRAEGRKNGPVTVYLVPSFDGFEPIREAAE